MLLGHLDMLKPIFHFGEQYLRRHLVSSRDSVGLELGVYRGAELIPLILASGFPQWIQDYFAQVSHRARCEQPLPQLHCSSRVL